MPPKVAVKPIAVPPKPKDVPAAQPSSRVARPMLPQGGAGATAAPSSARGVTIAVPSAAPAKATPPVAGRRAVAPASPTRSNAAPSVKVVAPDKTKGAAQKATAIMSGSTSSSVIESGGAGRMPKFLLPNDGDDSSPFSQDPFAPSEKRTVSARPSIAGARNVDEIISEKVIGPMKKCWRQIRRASEVGSPSDAELRKLESQKSELEAAKRAAAKAVASCGTGCNVVDEEIEAELQDFLDRIVMETDASAGSVELVAALTACLTGEPEGFARRCAQGQWLSNSAADGSATFVAMFLSLPGIDTAIENDVEDIVSTCLFNQACRIPLAMTLLRNEAPLHLENHMDSLEQTLQEFFEDVASSRKAIPREDRTDRMALLRALVTHKTIKIRLDQESDDAQTIVSRAAKEGDLQLLAMLHEAGLLVPCVNRVQSDTTTALIQAAFGNHVEVVRFLLALPNIDTTHASDQGDALTLARTLKRDLSIISALERVRR